MFAMYAIINVLKKHDVKYTVDMLSSSYLSVTLQCPLQDEIVNDIVEVCKLYRLLLHIMGTNVIIEDAY